MKHPKYYVIKFSDDATAEEVKTLVVSKLGTGISALASFETAKEIATDVEEFLE